MEQIDSYKIIGISTETINENGKSVEDLGKLWGRFYFITKILQVKS
jgi:predicted transcriptional regulator YdeE